MSIVNLHPYTVDINKYRYGWMNEHLYFFDNQEHMGKIMHIFMDYSKPEILEESPQFTIVGNERFNSLDARYVCDIVKKLFQNVVDAQMQGNRINRTIHYFLVDNFSLLYLLFKAQHH